MVEGRLDVTLYRSDPVDTSIWPCIASGLHQLLGLAGLLHLFGDVPYRAASLKRGVRQSELAQRLEHSATFVGASRLSTLNKLNNLFI